MLIQDPLLQRRTDATFSDSWSGAALSPTFINWPTYVPQLINNARGTVFHCDAGHNPWPLDRFITLLLGEIPRLMDDKNGYGPKGKNFLVHVDIPRSVTTEWRYLMEHPLLTAGWRNRI